MNIGVYLFFLFLPNLCIGQTDSNHKLKTVAREIMTTSKTCALITQDEDSNSRVRTMDPFAPEENFIVWFGTNSNSRKVTQIKRNSLVTLYYLSEDQNGYVTLHGLAQIVDSSEEKEKYWKQAWQEFYPNKPEGYSLIKFTPQWLEVISEPHGILGDSVTWEPRRVVFD